MTNSLFNEMLEDFFGSVPYRFYLDTYESEEDREEGEENVIKFLHDTPGLEFTLELDEEETIVTLTGKVEKVLYEKFPEDFEVNAKDWLLLVERYEAANKAVLSAMGRALQKKLAA